MDAKHARAGLTGRVPGLLGGLQNMEFHSEMLRWPHMCMQACVQMGGPQTSSLETVTVQISC